MDQELAGQLVSGPGLHGSVESAGSGERGEFVGAGGELLLLEALLLGFRGSLVGGELVLDDGVAVWVVGAAGGGEQLRDALPLSNFGRAAFVVGQVFAIPVDVLQPGVLERDGGLVGGSYRLPAGRPSCGRPSLGRPAGGARPRRARERGDGGGNGAQGCSHGPLNRHGEWTGYPTDARRTRRLRMCRSAIVVTVGGP
ncbi:hypothetical protein [Streptomyces sp. G45]|uniref:hypothetical protein n=1 Tax=Streptomyces sp. G45 TaxID=3406627 RepID=UPI003C15528D